MINDRVSELFVLLKVGDYAEPLSQVMTRIKREMGLMGCTNPRPWYPFAYQHTPSDDKTREHLKRWKLEHQDSLPERVDVLFSPNDNDYDEWTESCRHVVPARPDVDLSYKASSWRYMNRPVDWMYEIPGHFAVWGDKMRYYALIIEELELYPSDCIETLSLQYCRTYPGNVRIGRANTVNLWRKDASPKSAIIQDLSIMGRAILREPFAVELHKRCQRHS